LAPHIFISYNREDQHRARAIADGLEAEGINVWWDANLRAGESYDEVTEKHLREAGAVVVLWSLRSVDSKWVRAEATVGERFSKLVPVMIEECERPLRFELIQTADLTRWHGERSDSNWREFLKSVKGALGHQEDVSAAPVAPAAASPGDVTIENTFWNSIKDGTEHSDFEAYLKRYPDGHFADLARNRIAALDRAAQAQRKAAPAAPPSQAPERLAPAPPAPTRTAQASSAKAPQSQPVAQSRESKTNFALMGGVALIIAGLVGAVILGMQFLGEDEPEQVVAAVEAAPNTPEAGEPAESAVADIQSATLENTATADGASLTEDEAAEVSLDPPAIDADESLTADALTVAEDNMGADEQAPNEVETVTGLQPGDSFADCDQCPEMLVLPGGSFLMGSPDDEPGRYPYEGPQHDVEISSFAIGKYEVTFDQWAVCLEDGGCGGYEPGDAGFGRGARPALYISWQDAQRYVDWLSQKTGKSYRLPTEAEWEYAARAGEPAAYWWGARFSAANVALGRTVEAGELGPNGFGLHEVLGNAGEWVQDCYVNNFTQTPRDGSAATDGDCGRRVVRGGTWRSESAGLRVANRSRITATTRDRSLGFRVAADLP
ncbi:MAG: SUMF1/EgtB/PvdO family nonheme iron enzyme, partial [Pseudomonadota bacterium]